MATAGGAPQEGLWSDVELVQSHLATDFNGELIVLRTGSVAIASDGSLSLASSAASPFMGLKLAGEERARRGEAG